MEQMQVMVSLNLGLSLKEICPDYLCKCFEARYLPDKGIPNVPTEVFLKADSSLQEKTLIEYTMDRLRNAGNGKGIIVIIPPIKIMRSSQQETCITNVLYMVVNVTLKTLQLTT